jgi:protein disulfide-isomerase
MKKLTFILLTLWLAGRVLADESAWQTSFPEAAEQASREGKLLLLDFTGSDWCGWCIKLDGETFSRAEFLDYASRNVVLVKVDFPMHKSQPDGVKAANSVLKKQYGVSGFPTVLVLRPDGKVLWQQTGYAPGGPKVMIDALNRCRRSAGLPILTEPFVLTAAAPIKPTAPAPAPIAVRYEIPVHPPENPGVEPRLQGILYSASHSSAVLNGKTCEEGDTVHGMRVLKIARDTVTVDLKGHVKVLTMN